MDFDVEIGNSDGPLAEAPFGINDDHPPTSISIQVKGQDGEWYWISIKNIRKEGV